VDDDGRKQGGKKFTEHTSEFQMVNNFRVGRVVGSHSNLVKLIKSLLIHYNNEYMYKIYILLLILQ